MMFSGYYSTAITLYRCTWLSIILTIVSSSSQESCTQGFMDYELLSQKASQIGDPPSNTDTVDEIGSDDGGRRYVMPGLRFTCSGTITGLLLAADIRIDGNRNQYPWISLYEVDTNEFSFIRRSRRDIILGADDFSTSGLYNYTLSSPLQYTSGQILGVRQPDTDRSVVRLFYKQYDGNDSIVRIINSSGKLIGSNSGTISNSRLLVYPIITTDDTVSTSVDSCLPGSISLEDIRKSARLVTTVAGVYQQQLGRDRFYKDISFTCDAVITHIVAGMKNNTEQDSANPPEIRIWRPDMNSNNDDYTQSSTTVTLWYSDAVSDISTDYLRWYNLSVPVPVQEGDVLGIYHAIPTDTLSDAVIYYQRFSGPVNYAHAGDTGEPTGFNAYPLVSVIVSTVTGTTSKPTLATPTATSSLFATQSITNPVSKDVPPTQHSVSRPTDVTSTANILSRPTDVTSTANILSRPADVTTANTMSLIFTNPTPSGAAGAAVSGQGSPIAGIVAGTLVTVLVLGVVGTIGATIAILLVRRKRKTKKKELQRKRSLVFNENNDEFNNGLTNIAYEDVSNHSPDNAHTTDLSNPMYQDTAMNQQKSFNNTYQSVYDPLNNATAKKAVRGNDAVHTTSTLKRYPSPYEVPQQNSLPPALEPGMEALYSEAGDVFSSNAHSNDPISNATYALLDEHEDSSTYQLYSSIQSGLCVPTIAQRQELSLSTTTQEDLYGILEEQYSSISDCTEGFFKEEPIYWDPENTTRGIYEQLAQRRYREIPRHEIRIVSHLGSGQFGTVDKGVWDTPKGAVEVAVKTLSGSISEEDELKFLQEAAINGQFHHPNVVQLCGVVTVGQPTMIVLEYITHGDLKSFLERNLRPAPGELPDSSLAPLLFKFSHQVAQGMVYLSGKKFIHRDLAARNILVSNGTVCKIADFGMSRNLQDEAYYTSKTKKIPVKWTAPEAIHYKKYSCQSDVWSYGAVLYEIWSIGIKPFKKHTNQEYIRLIDSGYRLPSPSGCPRAIYQIMIDCWNPVPSDRPTFNSLQLLLSNPPSSPSDHPLSNLGSSVQDTSSPSLYPDLHSKYMRDN